jgi:hypothetical protein
VLEDRDPALLMERAYSAISPVGSVREAQLFVRRNGTESEYKVRLLSDGPAKLFAGVTGPADKAGSSALLLDSDLWNVDGKTGRVLAVPQNAREVAWLGSDIFYSDVFGVPSAVGLYQHRVTNSETTPQGVVHTIESKTESVGVPPKILSKVRSDGTLLSKTVYGQDFKAIRQISVTQKADASIVWLVEDLRRAGHTSELRFRELSKLSAADRQAFSLARLPEIGERLRKSVK